ncbi:MAG: S1 RNA-binding domain-containing protein [Candidatus Marsarchaeota archaeon]|nr:S1 RNA-binding domain-containing protein [Candidatus Marsarchaeota archaeon]MCL5112570.1 S1 RNA-binding domain-containing protein [Candidatus Marsarchaeota archaeon]
MQEVGRTPKVGELLIAEIAKITKFGAYCHLLEYNNAEAFMPIKEVSSGWIKNIHEFIHQGQKVVCKVIFIDKYKNTIDISLKKVTPKESKERIGKYNLENRLHGLILQSIKMAGLQSEKDSIFAKIDSAFPSYTEFVISASEDAPAYESLNIPKKFKEALIETIKANMKEKKHEVSYIATVYTQNTMVGIDELRAVFSKMIANGVKVGYISAPKYRIQSEGASYAEAEAKVKKAMDAIKSFSKDITYYTEKEKIKKEKQDTLYNMGI